MARRLDWEKRNLAGKRKQSVADEKEFLQRDLAARWLEKAESRQQQESRQNAQQTQRQQRPATGQPNKTKSAQPRRFEPKAKQRAGAAKRFKDLRPDDPRDQLADVDMTKMPWD
jgi:hypothetical protein